MNTRILFTSLILALLLQGCLDITTTTKLHPDGSLTRTVLLEGDHHDIELGSRLLAIDSTWARVIDTAGNRDLRITATREFTSSEEATGALAGVPLKKIGITVNVEKRFRWFMTNYRYQETWKKLTPFDRVPMSSYLSKREIEMFLAAKGGDDSTDTPGDKLAKKAAEERVTEWMKRNAFEDYFSRILDGAKAVNDPSLPVDSIRAAKDRIYARLSGMDSDKWKNDDSVRQVFSAELKSPIIGRVFQVSAPSLQQFKDAMQFLEDAGRPKYTMSVIVPGLITNTNAETVEGNKVSWANFKDTAVWVADYTMWVESSVANWWAIVGTGAVVIGIGVVMVIGLVRKK
jgi:hypothetical protein